MSICLALRGGPGLLTDHIRFCPRQITQLGPVVTVRHPAATRLAECCADLGLQLLRGALVQPGPQWSWSRETNGTQGWRRARGLWCSVRERVIATLRGFEGPGTCLACA
ncbi:hypothetical protein FA13DRAFT_965288 [Coprinellus micaceus]|uniref:Uncharacterized protein n=1 Tax=Coprinellus micaceus TaxID=71717 RepID=A0A4Y7RVQ4_COPMI|nr:hypothetical protein FA13DRAFT_965288 [Coprinellus micaceus]